MVSRQSQAIVLFMSEQIWTGATAFLICPSLLHHAILPGLRPLTHPPTHAPTHLHTHTRAFFMAKSYWSNALVSCAFIGILHLKFVESSRSKTWLRSIATNCQFPTFMFHCLLQELNRCTCWRFLLLLFCFSKKELYITSLKLYCCVLFPRTQSFMCCFLEQVARSLEHFGVAYCFLEF